MLGMSNWTFILFPSLLLTSKGGGRQCFAGQQIIITAILSNNSTYLTRSLRFSILDLILCQVRKAETIKQASSSDLVYKDGMSRDVVLLTLRKSG
jgi:hypothetical protein